MGDKLDGSSRLSGPHADLLRQRASEADIPPAPAGLLGMPLLDGRHTPQNICVAAFALGALAGGLVTSASLSTSFRASELVLGAAAVLAAMEYIAAAITAESRGLASFIPPSGTAWALLLFCSTIESALWQVLFGQALWPLSLAVARLGAAALVLAQLFRTLALVGPLTDYPAVRPIVEASKRVWPYWANARASSMVLWLVAAHLTQRSFISLALTVGMHDVFKPPGPDAFVWPEVSRRTRVGRRGFLGLQLFDGRHSQQNIAAYGFCLGFAAGLGVVFGTTGFSASLLGIYLMFLCAFHTLEYLTTVMYKPDASLRSFLLNHSPEYHMAIAGGLAEFFVEWFFFPAMKHFTWITYVGLVVVIVSQYLRSAAMITAGSNFSHIIADYKEDGHELVTTGIYGVFRHPSYTGFFYWTLALQVVLANPLCFCAFAVVLFRFFSERIEYEEETLQQFFGDKYRVYKMTSHTFIPGIP
ncbi:farnesyl cysteine-carboxyl methyltransferase [Polyrhizophydium stewartii]|uniref:Protein-S-isoprenylcysteine O-methyltransferase n=1 Tax=Polyrhizophydium stewartii TaxID=2732419 RepID=A0ABR4ND54_9FUNG